MNLKYKRVVEIAKVLGRVGDIVSIGNVLGMTELDLIVASVEEELETADSLDKFVYLYGRLRTISPEPEVAVRLAAKINELLIPLIDAAQNADTCMDLCRMAPHRSPAARLVMAKYDKLLLEVLDAAETIEQCREVGGSFNNQLYVAAYLKIDRILAEKLKTASSVDDYQYILQWSKNRPRVWEKAVEGLVALLNDALDQAISIAECFDIYRKIPKRCEFAKRVVAKIDTLSEPILDTAQTVELCVALYESVPLECQVSSRARQKALLLARDFADCELIIEKTNYREFEKDLFEKALRFASTLEQCQYLYNKSTYKSTQRDCILKIDEILTAQQALAVS